jgi:tetrapyrrole methylase family protein/MazG family protein
MSTLRGPRGCPWDKQQTRKSLKPYLIEEAYEVLEALEGEGSVKYKEELGDLLFQIVFHCQIAQEQGEFDITQVMESSYEKMVGRHPHVFGEAKAGDVREILLQWEELKRDERKRKNQERKSILEGVPRELPSLLRAHRLQDRAARVGFDWKDVQDVINKVDEELEEFRQALKSGSPKELEDELGDVFFALVNLSRFIRVNPEEALRKCISRFISRFRYIEEEIAKSGRDMRNVTLEEMEALWQEAKGRE